MHECQSLSCCLPWCVGRYIYHELTELKMSRKGNFRPIFLPMVCSLFYILSKYMYMLCNTHNPEMNKMLYSWFVNLFLVCVFFNGDISLSLWYENRTLSKEHPIHSCCEIAYNKHLKNKTSIEIDLEQLPRETKWKETE